MPAAPAAKKTEVSLSRALRLAKRLKGQIGQVTSKIQEANCTQEGHEVRDVNALYAQRQEMIAALVDLKMALSTANHANNAEGQRLILAISEVKGEIAMWEGMETKNGEFNEGYRSERPVKYTSQITEAARDARVLALQSQLEDMQERLESFNGRSRIAVDDRVVSLQWGPATAAE